MFWIYFENNKQDLWCIYLCMYEQLYFDWLDRALSWKLSTAARLLNCELRIIFKKRSETKMYKYKYICNRQNLVIGYENFAFSSPKLKEKWIPTHCHWNRPFNENEQKNVLLFRIKLEIKWSNEEMEEKNKSNNWLKKHLAPDRLVVYFAIFAFGTEYM